VRGALVFIFFDSLIVTLIIFSFCRRMKEFKQWRRFLFQNWYEIPGMIPIFFLPSVSDGFITVGVILRVLAIIYIIKLSHSLEEKSRILGGRILQIFIIFFLTLTISAFLFYSVEHTVANSEITTMVMSSGGHSKLHQLLHLDPMQLLLQEE